MNQKLLKKEVIEELRQNGYQKLSCILDVTNLEITWKIFRSPDKHSWRYCKCFEIAK